MRFLLLCSLMWWGCSPTPPGGGESVGPVASPPAAVAEARPVAAKGRAAAPEPPSIPAPSDLTVDLHVDTVTMMMRDHVGWSDGSLQASLPALREAGVDVVLQAAWIERGEKQPLQRAIGKLERIRAMVANHPREAAIAAGPEQLEQVVSGGRIAVVLALEGGTALHDVASLRTLRRLGLSVVGLTWTESSPHADSSAEPRRPGGLTDSGRELVQACNDLGLILDVSHMSDAATEETVRRSRAPVLASHSNWRRLADVPRNLPDALVDLIAQRGGLIGVMFHGPFLAVGRPATRADAVAHIAGLAERVGAEHVGVGSDFDGIIQAPLDLATARQLPPLWDDLRARGLTEHDVAAVRGNSFRRLWRAVWSARAAEQAGSTPP